MLASTCYLGEAGDQGGYGRSSNPTWLQVESAIAELERATGAPVFASGMAAISAGPGSALVVPADVLGRPNHWA